MLAARTGIAILVFGLLLYPLTAPLAGRPWAQAELFGVTADPTAAATLGFLLATRAPWFLWPVPVAWSLFSGATHRAMEAPDGWLLPGLALLTVVARAISRRAAS